MKQSIIQKVLDDVLRTPSPENCQPWYIEVHGNVLKTFHKSNYAKLATFPDDLSVLGAGMIAEKPSHYIRSRLWQLSYWLDWFPEILQKLESRFFDDSAELTPRSFEDGAGIGCITVFSNDSTDLVDAGSLVLRMWLMLNLEGYGFHPMENLPSIIYPKYFGYFDLPENLKYLIDGGYDILQDMFGYSNDEVPIFCFRTGRPLSDYPLNARTLRRKQNYKFVQ